MRQLTNERLPTIRTTRIALPWLLDATKSQVNKSRAENKNTQGCSDDVCIFFICQYNDLLLITQIEERGVNDWFASNEYYRL